MATVKEGRTSIQVVVSEEARAALKAFADERGIMLSTIIRTAVKEWAERNGVQVTMDDVVRGKQPKARRKKKGGTGNPGTAD